MIAPREGKMGKEAICASCGILITWLPTIVDGRTYCCLGCSRGGPCECDYSNLPQPEDSTALVPSTQTGKDVLQEQIGISL
ncbi:MAG: hypothetical protein ACUVV0_17165 [Anaerolineae bacterium]